MIRIIGLGSPFGKDRVGWLAIDALRGHVPDEVDLRILDRPGASLIQWMKGVRHLIVIDAVIGEQQATSFLRIDPSDIDSSKTAFLGSHALNLQETIELAGVLGMLPGRIDIFAIPIGDKFTPAETGATQRMVKPLVDYLITKLQHDSAQQSARTAG